MKRLLTSPLVISLCEEVVVVVVQKQVQPSCNF